MKYKFILSTIALFLLTSCTEQKTKNDLTKENLKGKVKSVKETPYLVIEKFGEVIKGDIYIRGSFISDDYFILLSSIQHKTYNEIGFETEIQDFDTYGTTLKRSIFNYNKKRGKLILLTITP